MPAAPSYPGIGGWWKEREEPWLRVARGFVVRAEEDGLSEGGARACTKGRLGRTVKGMLSPMHICEHIAGVCVQAKCASRHR